MVGLGLPSAMGNFLGDMVQGTTIGEERLGEVGILGKVVIRVTTDTSPLDAL